MSNIIFAFLLTLIAGLSTGIGSLISFFSKTTNTKFLCVSLGFSAGVMLYVSFVEMFFKAKQSLESITNSTAGTAITLAGFFGGMLLIFVINKLMPSAHKLLNKKSVMDISRSQLAGTGDGQMKELNGQLADTGDGQMKKLENQLTDTGDGQMKKLENQLTDAGDGQMKKLENQLTDADNGQVAVKAGRSHALAAGDAKINKLNLKRMGVFTALAIAVHNFPEGLATFVSALNSPIIAVPIVIAIALHNIPEGIAVSIPIYYATGSKKKALMYSFASGFAEPIGAIVGYLVLMPFLNDIVFGILLAIVAGIMVYISIAELLPAARAYGKQHLSVYSFILGMLVISLSMLLAEAIF